MKDSSTLVIQAHSRDANDWVVILADGRHVPVVSHDYIPSGLGIGGGDRLYLQIDVSTGRILNWNPDAMKAALDDLVACQGESDDRCHLR